MSGTILATSDPLWIGGSAIRGSLNRWMGGRRDHGPQQRADRRGDSDRYLQRDSTAPLVNAGPDARVAEGETFHRTGFFFDPDSDIWDAIVDYGDGTGVRVLQLNTDKSFVLAHIYAADGVYPVRVTLSDDTGDVGIDAFRISVTNVAPTITQFSVTPATFGAATTVTASGQFTDPGTLDTHTATIDWGDGSAIEPLPLNPDRTFEAGHTYDRFGVFRRLSRSPMSGTP